MNGKGLQIATATSVFAILLWGSVKLSNEHYARVQIPFHLVNTPAGFAPSSSLPKMLELTFRGGGWHLMSHLWDSGPGVSVDVGSSSSYQKVLTIRDIVRLLDIPQGLEVTDMNPDSVFITFEPYAQKKVPVLFDMTLSFADGYGLSGDPVIVPESVTVGGATTTIAGMTSWSGGHLMLGDLKTPIEHVVSVDSTDSNVLQVTPSSVSVILNVQPIAEKRIRGIPVTVLSLPSNREVVFIPPKLDILVRGGIDQLAEFDVSDCEATVLFGDLIGDTVYSVVPHVSIPAGLVIIHTEPQQFQFVIRTNF